MLKGGSLSTASCCCILLVVSSVSANFPVYTASGTYFEVGQSVGAQAKSQILLRLTRPGVNATLRPFLATPTGKVLFNNLHQSVEMRFPHLVEELRGIAQGSGVSFTDIFMLNMVDEIESYVGFYNVSTREHCTDVLTNSKSPAWGHNEDGDVNDKMSNYFVNATIFAELDHKTIVEQFMAFTYAGTVAGDAYGWNFHGLAISQNAIFANQLNYFGVPGQVSARAAYGAKSIDELVDIVRFSSSANSYNLNVASTRNGRVVNVEVDPMGLVGVHDVAAMQHDDAPVGMVRPPYWFFHTNMYRTITTACVTDASSVHRMSTLAKYHVPNATVDVRQMLGDTSDPLYPIYRDGKSPDTDVVTLTTVVYDLAMMRATIFDTNPRGDEPLFTFPLW
jgi:hypothetical protein